MLKIFPKKFQRLLLAWFDQSGRKNLPWQKNKTPYRVWVSEIMLQQTQVSTVIAYFERFMKRFPTLESLAYAKEDEVLHLWTGLGYYNRARNLHRAAKMVLEDYQGQFPSDVTSLQTLPGIGRSTAGAISSIAFKKRAPILDGNVKRVLTRLHGIEQWPGDKHITEQLWQIADQYTPQERVADYTQAMMDLGATLCVRGKPDCVNCPFIKMCIAHTKGLEKKLPISKPRKIMPVRQATLLILQHTHSILLEKRPSTGVWGNLWSLPEIRGIANVSEIEKICREYFRIKIKKVIWGVLFRHTFSHFHLDILPAFIQITKSHLAKIMAAEQQIWYNLKDPPKIGLPAPIKLLLERLK